MYIPPAPEKLSVRYSYHNKTESHALYLTATDDALLRGAEEQRIRKKIKAAYLENIRELANDVQVSASREVRIFQVLGYWAKWRILVFYIC